MDTAEIVNDILAHVGVKGMRWGVRRKATVGPREVVISDRRKKLKTSGGQGHPAHQDVVRVRTTGQIGKKSGFKAISDNDLQNYARRLNLEANVKRLEYGEKNAAKKFVATILGNTGKTHAQDLSNQAAAKTGKRIKKFVVAAAAAA